jgi:hypothetical protein
MTSICWRSRNCDVDINCFEMVIKMDNQSRKFPKRLYKYRGFSDCTLDMVLSDNLYYANPSTFNDPLDTRPSLEIDLDEAELKKLLMRFVVRRTDAEMSAAAKTIWWHVAPDLMDKIKQSSRVRAAGVIEEKAYPVGSGIINIL